MSWLPLPHDIEPRLGVAFGEGDENSFFYIPSTMIDGVRWWIWKWKSFELERKWFTINVHKRNQILANQYREMWLSFVVALSD